MPRSSMPSATKLSGEALVTTHPVAILHTMEQNANLTREGSTPENGSMGSGKAKPSGWSFLQSSSMRLDAKGSSAATMPETGAGIR